jgi:hypothetical protein
MNKYIVDNFPEPSAERMKENSKTITVMLVNGWGFSKSYEYVLPKEQDQLIFDVETGFVPSYTNKVMDADVFDVTLTYSNTTKSRNEHFVLEPRKC